MRIQFVTPWDHDDPWAFSGSSRFMWKAFERAGLELHFVDNLKKPRLNYLRQRSKQAVDRLVGRGHYLRLHDPRDARAMAIQASQRLDLAASADWIVSPSSIPIAFLPGCAKVLIWTDACFESLLGYYTYDISQEALREGYEVENGALQRTSLAIYSSDWAARSAVLHHGLQADKARVASFGANVDCTRTEQDIEAIIARRYRGTCNLLFIAKDWERKGGDMAVAVCRELNRMGVPARLWIVGCNPVIPAEARAPCIKVGPINKATETGRQRFDSLLMDAHFVLVPSRADCTPMVIAEANSFGVPSACRVVGGTPTLIRDELNGKLFDDSASPETWAAWIAERHVAHERYADLARSSFREYKTRLNWDNAVASVIEYMRNS